MDINRTHPITQMTCLHIVAMTGYFPLALYLLQNGASLDVVDAMNRTPKQVAEEHGHLEIRKLFAFWKKKKAVVFAPSSSKINDK